MLKNQKEREEYLMNENNWEIVGCIENVMRLCRLKRTNIYKVQRYNYNQHFGHSWLMVGEYYIKTESAEPIGTVLNGAKGKTAIIEYIKEFKEHE